MPRSGFAAGFFALLFAASGAMAMPQHARSGLAGLAGLAGPAGLAGIAGDDASAPKADVGYLTVTTDPPAKLEIDGTDTGKTTPVTKLSLSVGKHKVTVTSLDGKTKRTLGVTIVAGEEKRLTVSL
jgi:hypothetical protein